MSFKCLECSHGLVFLSKATPKCRCFSLAQCFLWWWGWTAENRSINAVIDSVFCHSWGPYTIAKLKSLERVDIQHFSQWLVGTVSLIGLIMSTSYFHNLNCEIMKRNIDTTYRCSLDINITQQFGDRKFNNEWFVRNW